MGAEGIGDHRGHLVGDGNARHRQPGFHRGRCRRAIAAKLPVGRPAARDRPPVNHRAWYVHTWTPSAANALGIARGAIDSLAEIAATEASTMSANLLRDRPMVQTRIAEAEAIVNAARAFVFDAVGRLWRTLCAGETPSDQEIAQGRLALVHAMHESVRAVDKVFHAAGTNAIYTRLPLERALPRRSRRSAACRGVAELFRIGGEGASRATARRSRLVIGNEMTRGE